MSAILDIPCVNLIPIALLTLLPPKLPEALFIEYKFRVLVPLTGELIADDLELDPLDDPVLP